MKAVLFLLALGCIPLRAATYYVTIAGIGGEPEYEQRFTSIAQDIDKRLHAVDSTAKIVTLYGPVANKAHVRATFEEISRQAGAEDRLAVFLIGHGTFDGEEYKLNIPGPDITATELAAWLNRIPAGKQLVVDMTSSSGAAAAALTHAHRIVITATKSGTEKNLTVFPRFFADALRDESADTDKNQTISALEAYRYAQQKTAAFYQTEKRLATEHSQLIDTATGTPVVNPSAENGQGLLAAQFPLLNLGSQTSGRLDPAKAKLLAHKQDLEGQIDELKYRKASIPEVDYTKQLTTLLLDLARTQAELDK